MTPFLRRALPWVLLLAAYVGAGEVIRTMNLPTWTVLLRWGVFPVALAWLLYQQRDFWKEAQNGRKWGALFWLLPAAYFVWRAFEQGQAGRLGAALLYALGCLCLLVLAVSEWRKSGEGKG